MVTKTLIAFLIATASLSANTFGAGFSRSPLGFYWGDCALNSDPKLGQAFADNYAKICIKPEIHQSISIQQTNNHNLYDHYSRIYTGVHTPGSIGLHWSAFQQLQVDDGPGAKLKTNRNTDTAILTIGKLGLHRFLLAGGKQKMGFGIGLKPQSAFLESHTSPSFWDSPPYSITATWDNLVDATGEISVGIDDPEELLFLERELKSLSIASRIIYDSPAWFGTRFVLSGLAHHNGERRYGIGMLNIAPNGASSLIEWIRSRHAPDGKGQHFKQIIRFTLVGERRWNKKPYFIYDDVRHTHRFFTIGQEFYFYRNMSLRLSLAYMKDESGQHEHLFYGVGGLSLQI